MFWTQNINLLLQPVLIPTDYMSDDDKLNALTRLVIFVCTIFALILRDTKIILFMIIIVIAIVIIHSYQNRFRTETEYFLNKNNLDVVENKTCIKPTKDNPFMNPIIPVVFDNSDVTGSNGACPINNSKIQDQIDTLYDESMYRDSDDIYDRTTGKRQFYTVPGSRIPNDQTVFANWLYNRGKSCKENNGEQCYDNLYRDLRI